MKYAAFLEQITDFIFVENKPEKSDIIFIPGSGFPQLAEEAAQFYHVGFAPRILPSGRYSITQGHFGGVQEKTEQYPGTYENAIYSRKVTDALGLDIRQAILCCKPYHARRSLLYYQLLYPETHFLVCPVKDSQVRRENWYKTEKGINLVLGEIERIGVQFHEILRGIREETTISPEEG